MRSYLNGGIPKVWGSFFGEESTFTGRQIEKNEESWDV